MAKNGDEVLNQTTQSVAAETKKREGKLKYGIIGTGWIAESHIQSLLKMDDVEIVALADLIPGKAEAFAEQWGVKGARYYPDHASMLKAEKLDAVSNCTYNVAHAQTTIDALNAGVNVLLEKPMCVTTEEAVEIMRAEKKSGKLLSIGFQPRMDENMKMIKRIVDSGVLGKIYYIQTGGGRRRGIPNSTFIEKSTGGIGAMGDIGCYSLDMVLNAIGYPKPLTVTGYTSNFFGTNPKYQRPDKFHTAAENAARFGVEDFAAAFVRLEGDIILDFRISWAMHLDTPGDTVILGLPVHLRGVFEKLAVLIHELFHILEIIREAFDLIGKGQVISSLPGRAHIIHFCEKVSVDGFVLSRLGADLLRSRFQLLGIYGDRNSHF